MRVHLLGVRGSTPATGLPYVRYGGATSCVAIADGDSGPVLVLDAGTGLRGLGDLLAGAPFRGTIALTHLHWDHVQGLPFAPCVDRPDACVELVLPAQHRRSGRAALRRQLSPPSFPIGPGGLRGSWRIRGAGEGTFRAGPFAVTAATVPHKGGRTYGYRVSGGGATLAYLPDHALSGGATPAALELARGADVLLHDASNLPGERAVAADYGHTTVDDAVAFARAAGVGRLVLTHHAPARTDDALDALAASLSDHAVLAREGDVLQVGPFDRSAAG